MWNLRPSGWVDAPLVGLATIIGSLNVAAVRRKANREGVAGVAPAASAQVDSCSGKDLPARSGDGRAPRDLTALLSAEPGAAVGHLLATVFLGEPWKRIGRLCVTTFMCRCRFARRSIRRRSSMRGSCGIFRGLGF